MKKKPPSPAIPEENFAMDIDGECAEVPMTPKPSPAILTEAAAQSVNTDLGIRIPVLKRKRGE